MYMENFLQQDNRIVELDILRGFALFGILIVNIGLLGFPAFDINPRDYWHEPYDQFTVKFLYLFAEGKFISIFSFLFGLGFIIFMKNANSKGKNAKALFLRRMAILFIIGLIHGYFIWFGDVLMVYSILGCILYLTFNRKNTKYPLWALLLCLSANLFFTILIFLDKEPVNNLNTIKESINNVHHIIDIYSKGTWQEIFSQNHHDLLTSKYAYTLCSPQILSMFFLGAFAGEIQLFSNIKRLKGFIITSTFYCFVLSIFIVIFNYYLIDTPPNTILFNAVDVFNTFIGSPIISLLYILIFTLLLQKEWFYILMTPLKVVGRMALTNYVFQSVTGIFLFYSMGLGLYGTISPAVSMLIALIIFTIQIALSHVWMELFRYGPLEWLWRIGTYMKLVPILKK
ncbi:hypothetical protein ATB96_14290 [Elizabethkingia ursingii]|nr:hypothetical protein ATB96_14290 [Elizabethkingia ursingii]